MMNLRVLFLIWKFHACLAFSLFLVYFYFWCFSLLIIFVYFSVCVQHFGNLVFIKRAIEIKWIEINWCVKGTYSKAFLCFLGKYYIISFWMQNDSYLFLCLIWVQRSKNAGEYFKMQQMSLWQEDRTEPLSLPHDICLSPAQEVKS